MTDKFILLWWGVIIGFLGNSILMRLAGNIPDSDIIYPCVLLAGSLIALLARLTK